MTPAPRNLPSGTITFLFTDIEGSTKLLHELGPEGYAEALGEHRRLLRTAFDRHGGVEVDTQGDAFFIVFPTAPGALKAAGLVTMAPTEERRLITIFFTDIVGSTAIAEGLDPEEWQRTVAAVHAVVGAAPGTDGTRREDRRSKMAEVIPREHRGAPCRHRTVGTSAL